MVTVLRRKGHTLMELLAVAAVIGVVISVSPRFIRGIMDFFLLSKARAEVERETQNAMEEILRQIRRAQAMSGTASMEPGQPYPSKITFTTREGTTVSIFQVDRRLQVTDGAQTRTLTDKLRSLAFDVSPTDYGGPMGKKISVSLALEVGSGPFGRRISHLVVENAVVF